MEQVKLLLRILQNMTELPVLTWDGQLSSLEDYEKQHLFLRQAQPLLEATALQTLLENLHSNILYGVKDLLGMELLLFWYEDCPFVIGPYTTQAWNDKEGEHTLASLGLPSSYLIPYKLYYGSYSLLAKDTIKRMVTGSIAALQPDAPPYVYRSLSELRGPKHRTDLFQEDPPDFEQAVRRYERENRFLARIEAGDAIGALEHYKRMRYTSISRTFSPHNMQAMIANATIVRTMARKAAERGGAHPAVIDSISVTYAQKMYACTDAKSLYVLIQEMIRELCDVVAACHQHQYSPPVRRAISYLELHISQNITLPALAKASKVSRSYLSRLFTAETGETVSHFISRTRCEKAAALLRTTDLPIQDISAHVGYLDNNYFDKVFRSYYGVTPTAYRNHR